MFVCPHCTKRLSHSSSNIGPSWPCTACGGVAFPLATLRQTRLPDWLVSGLMEKARAGEGIKGRFCPICSNWMCGLPVPVDGDSVTLDVCASCELFWFDPKEFERVLPPEMPVAAVTAPPARMATPPVPPGTVPPPPWVQPSPADESRPSGAAGSQEYEDEIKLRWWNWLTGFLGLPVEIQAPKRRHQPSATATLAAILAGISFSIYTFFPGITTWLGFSSEWPFRLLGLTLVTSFFLHNGLFHLLGNIYFLMTFGDNVEDFLGVKRFLLLILGSTVFGNLVQYAADPYAHMLLIGASGGIAGVVAFYGLQFRHARVAVFLLRIIPVKLKAVWALVFWFGFQLLGAAMGWVNTDHTAYAAHLGGAATGMILWRQWQQR
jgi:membrane associated rhomboid family serine protease/Zn-finger nucleic acid-binding protein